MKAMRANKNRGFSPGLPPGFSLVELLVIVGIIGVLAVVAMPVFSGYKSGAVKRELVRKAESFFSTAQMCLLESGTPLTDCDSKLKIGFYCPSGCEELKTNTTDNSLLLQITIDGASACAAFYRGVCHDASGIVSSITVCPAAGCPSPQTCRPARNLRMKGICHKGNIALNPIKFCENNGQCVAVEAGSACHIKDAEATGTAGAAVCQDKS